MKDLQYVFPKTANIRDGTNLPFLLTVEREVVFTSVTHLLPVPAA